MRFWRLWRERHRHVWEDPRVYALMGITVKRCDCGEIELFW